VYGYLECVRENARNGAVSESTQMLIGIGMVLDAASGLGEMVTFGVISLAFDDDDDDDEALCCASFAFDLDSDDCELVVSFRRG
jgi:hypothetical protein